MANEKTTGKAGSRKEHKAHWQQPWAQRVLQGNYSSFEKLLFMRIASFGAAGCWMRNEVLMAELNRCERNVRTAIAKLWEGKEFWITGWDSHKRCIYAMKNPEVVAMVEEKYRAAVKAGKVADKNDFYIKNKSRGYENPKSD